MDKNKYLSKLLFLKFLLHNTTHTYTKHTTLHFQTTFTEESGQWLQHM